MASSFFLDNAVIVWYQFTWQLVLFLPEKLTVYLKSIAFRTLYLSSWVTKAMLFFCYQNYKSTTGNSIPLSISFLNCSAPCFISKSSLCEGKDLFDFLFKSDKKLIVIPILDFSTCCQVCQTYSKKGCKIWQTCSK